MIVEKTTKHKAIFTVEMYWSEEDGMGTEQFGNEVDTIEEAIHLLEVANASQSQNETANFGYEWIIVCRVTIMITK